MNDKPYRRLERQNGMMAGVCGGLGEYFSVDPIWFRIVFFILLLPGGASAFPYFLLWLFMPKK